MKHLASLTLAVLMVFSLVVPAFADDYVPGTKPAEYVPADKKTARIYIAEPTAESNVGHAYTIYQLFVGEPFVDEDGELVLKSVKNGYSLGITSTLEIIQEYMNNPKNSNEDKRNYLESRRVRDKVYATMENGNVGASLDVEPGYYYIIDETATDAYVIIDMAFDKTEEGQLTYEPKAKIPTFKKEVRDNNAPDDVWGKVADFSFTNRDASALTPNLDGFDNPNVTLNAPNADTVAFRLTATLGDNYDMYDKYQLIFHDEMPTRNGPLFSLIGDESGNVLYRVEIVGADGESKFDTFSLNDKNGIQEGDLFNIPKDSSNSIEFRIDNIKTAFKKDGNLVELAANDEIRITYYAYTNNENFPLGDDATLAAKGEKPATNTAYLEYSNNPYHYEKTGKTPEDHVTVYSYGLMVLKTNKDSEPVSSAGFALYRKKDNTNEWVNMSGIAYGKEKPGGPDVILDIYSETYGNCYDMHEFTNATIWNQLDSGEYRLVEVEAPDGFEKLEEEIRFSVHRDEETGEVTLFQTDTDKNDMVTFEKRTEKVYRFDYYRSTGEVDEEGYTIYEDPIPVFINESSPLWRGTEGHLFFAFDEDGEPTIPANLEDLVDANDEYFAILDTNGGGWMLPSDNEVNEYQLFCITVRNGYTNGLELPLSGGMGTTLLYTLGSIMVVFAGIFLVTGKRMSKKRYDF